MIAKANCDFWIRNNNTIAYYKGEVVSHQCEVDLKSKIETSTKVVLRSFKIELGKWWWNLYGGLCGWTGKWWIWVYQRSQRNIILNKLWRIHPYRLTMAVWVVKWDKVVNRHDEIVGSRCGLVSLLVSIICITIEQGSGTSVQSKQKSAASVFNSRVNWMSQPHTKRGTKDYSKMKRALATCQNPT